MKALHLRHVGHRFALTQVLSGIDLTLLPGESVALVGPSGCGKTTLLNLIAGLLRCTEGYIESDFSSVGYVFQQPRLLPWKSALDNIALGLKARGAAKAQCDQKASELGLALGLNAADLQKFPHALSGLSLIHI